MDKKPSGFKARWKARYHHASIQLILSIAFTAVAVIGMLFLGMALLLRFSSSANEMAAESSQRVLAQVNWNLDSYLRNMMRVSDTVYYRVIKSADLEQSDTAQELRDALKLLYAKDRDVLVSLAVFDGNGELISATPLTELKNSVTPSREGWFTAAMERIENLHFSTPHVQHLFEDPDARYHWVVSLSRHVELTRGGVIQSGVLLVDMNFSGIEQICKDVSFFDGQGYLYLIDGNGEIIYHPRQQLLYAGLQEENNLTAAGYSDGTHTEIFQSQRRQVTVKTVGYTGWKLVGVVPAETLRDNYSQLLLFALFIVSFSIFLLVFVNLRLSEWITAPMKKLDHAVRELEKGVESVDFNVDGPYEVEHLSHSVQSMISTMRHLMEDVLHQEEEKRRSELDVLQSQINPHFIYNTLNSIKWMADMQGSKRMVTALDSMIKLMQFSSKNSREVIRIQDEIDLIRDYINLINLKYFDRIFVDVHVEPGLENCETLKFLLQPIVENSIYHGFSSMVRQCTVQINITRKEDRILYEVIDNGKGMSKEKIRQALEEDHPLNSHSFNKIGLYNVNKRIQYIFGEEYGIQIDSEPGKYTRVIVEIPARIYKEEMANA